MRYVQPMVLTAAVVFSLALVVLHPEPAEAQAGAQILACRKILAGGQAVPAESWGCNTNTAETRRIATGTYEVDFTVSTDISRNVKLATLDTQGAGSFAGAIGVADRSGDFSSALVVIRDTNGKLTNTGFNLCLLEGKTP